MNGITLDILIYVWIAVFALLIGSFLNVVAIRYCDGGSIVFPGSHCMHCQHRLGIFELVPLFSFLLSKGRCKHCQQPQSKLYPLGESTTCALFLIMYTHVGWSGELLVAWLFSSVLVVALIADLYAGLIPWRFTIPMLVVLLLIRTITTDQVWWYYGLAVGIMFLFFQAVEWLYQILRKTEQFAFGGGDVVLFYVIAATLGLKLTLLCLFLSSVLGIVFYYLRMGREIVDGVDGLDGGRAVRLAPAIAIAAVVCYLWGDALLALYFETLAGTSFLQAIG
jgi:prepilin signal peptidase PulO-like enzyme (type II secretory pathway)